MSSSTLTQSPCFLRQRALGSEAVYQVLAEDDRIVTAEVVSVPGLEPGTRVRLLARAARAMERFDPADEPFTVTRRFAAATATR